MQLKILETAISDVGSWSWWVANLPKAIQVEFNGVMLLLPPLGEGKPPCGQVALRFDNPMFVAFLTREFGDQAAPPDWPEMLHNDKLEVTPVLPDAFSLSEPQRLAEYVAAAKHVDVRLGDRVMLDHIPAEAAILAMWSNAIGMAVVAERFEIIGHAADGKPGTIPIEHVADLHNKWWEYWKDYWKSKNTDSPMPEDYACEVTIPLS